MSAQGWVLHICPAPCSFPWSPTGSFGHLDFYCLNWGTWIAGIFLSSGCRHLPNPFQNCECAEILWEKCWIHFPFTRRSGPPETTTKNLSSPRCWEFGVAPRQLTWAWTPPEVFCRDRVVAWMNGRYYRFTCKEEAKLCFSCLLSNSIILPVPQSCSLLPVPPLSVVFHWLQDYNSCSSRNNQSEEMWLFLKIHAIVWSLCSC